MHTKLQDTNEVQDEISLLKKKKKKCFVGNSSVPLGPETNNQLQLPAVKVNNHFHSQWH